MVSDYYTVNCFTRKEDKNQEKKKEIIAVAFKNNRPPLGTRFPS